MRCTKNSNITQFSICYPDIELYKLRQYRSRLLREGEFTPFLIKGRSLLVQYELPEFYMFITDEDCLFEEGTTITLIRKDLSAIVAEKSFGAGYASFNLDKICWKDDKSFLIVFYGGIHYICTIRSWGIPFIYPFIKAKFVGVRER